MNFCALFLIFTTTSFLAGSAVFADEDPITPPSVSKRVLICEAWQWIGKGATTWGCLTMPREAYVAGGKATDQMVASLQDQINKLEERLKKLENSK